MAFRSGMAIRGRIGNLVTRKGSIQSALVRHKQRTSYRPGVGMIAFRGRRGGFFKKLFKGVKKIVTTVAKVPVVGTVAKAAISSIPVVKAVTTAVNVVKKATASGVSAATAPITPRVDAPAYSSTAQEHAMGAPRRKAKRKAKKAKRKGGGTAKQRAARARFARAARKGRIKKGARL